MAKSIIQDTRIRECYLCREEAEKRGYYGELKHTGLHKHHLYMAGLVPSGRKQNTMGCGATCALSGTMSTGRRLPTIMQRWIGG